jgi:hypothetical protein
MWQPQTTLTRKQIFRIQKEILHYIPTRIGADRLSLKNSTK